MNQVDKALSDLNTAIQLSGGLGKAAEQAYTQRGLIHVLHSNEDEALQDFQVGINNKDPSILHNTLLLYSYLYYTL